MRAAIPTFLLMEEIMLRTEFHPFIIGVTHLLLRPIALDSDKLKLARSPQKSKSRPGTKCLHSWHKWDMFSKQVWNAGGLLY